LPELHAAKNGDHQSRKHTKRQAHKRGRRKEQQSLHAFIHLSQPHLRTTAAATTTDWQKHVAVPSHQRTQ
jgi:hypothetical protein